ncbi:MAG: hypothetical protein ABWY18_02940 [Tardiphaga sp.]
MQNPAAMNSDVKALLTLLALKTGTSSAEIHNSLQLAAASRLMMAEETNPSRASAETPASNVAKLRPANGDAADTTPAARRMLQTAGAMNSDIKALLTLLLFKNGADAVEIQTALRMAAAARANAAADEAETVRATASEAAPATTDHAASARQAIRNEQLAQAKEFAA